jgi:hypothetical protein
VVFFCILLLNFKKNVMKKQEIADEILRLLSIKAEQGDQSTGSTVTKQTWKKILDKVTILMDE